VSSLLLAGETPLPPNSGSRLRTVHLARSLAAELPVELAVLGPTGPSEGEPYPVTGVPHRRSRAAALAGSLTRPYSAAKASSRALAVLARERRAAVVQAQTLWVMPAAEAAPGAVVLDAHNVESDLLRRMAADEARPVHRARWRWEARKTSAWEHRAATAADAVCVTSAADGAAFERWGAREVVLVPNGVDASAVRYAPPAGGAMLAYVGHYGYQPNATAALELAARVLPRVQATVAGAEALIIGRDPTAELRGCERPGVRVTGTVPDVLPHLQSARALVVPLRSGGGTRLKVLEALAAGVPVISTPLGVEGLDLRDGEHILVGRTSEDLADLALRVIADDALAARLSAAGRAQVERAYDWRVVARPLIDLHLRLAGAA
jgi:glycosyltransferase involved in cell wall biosynthesis